MTESGGKLPVLGYRHAMTDAIKTIRIAAAQTPEFREDMPGALAYLGDVTEAAMEAGARLVCWPEGFLQGYLTEGEAARRNAFDLTSPHFSTLMRQLPEKAPMIVVGLIEAEGERLYNTAAVIHQRTLVGRYRKRHLLGREQCYQPGNDVQIFNIGGLRFGINICFDTNFASAAMSVAQQGSSLLICPANNMLPRQAAAEWKAKHNTVRGERCRETGLWLMSADVTGERDGWVAWGPTAVLNPAGEVVAQLPLDAPGLLVFDMPLSGTA
jgi:predicted amidohydrolase